jgi:hypothetical protein
MYTSNAADIQRRFDQLLENLPAGVVVHGPDGRILSANRLARELLGRSENQLIGSEADASTWSFVWPDRTTMPPAEYPVNVVLRTRAMVKDLIVGVPADLPEPVRWLPAQPALPRGAVIKDSRTMGARRPAWRCHVARPGQFQDGQRYDGARGRRRPAAAGGAAAA